MTASSAERYAYIDVLRGWAALFVVYQHAAEISVRSIGAPINAWEKTVIDFFTGTIGIGETGVCIFLMISGFVVPFSLFRYPSDPVKNFIAHRFFRLYPAYWLSVPLGLILVWWRFGMQNGGREIDWLTVFANISMFQAFFGIADIMGQYWTLSLELLFYGLCIVLFVSGVLDSFKAVLLVLIGLIIVREGARHVPDLPGDLFRVISYCRYIGFMFFGLMYRKWLLNADRRAGWHAVIVLMITFLMFGVINDARHFFSSDIFALKTQMTHAISITIFIAFTRFHQPSNMFGTFLGKISYSIYLFHPLVIYPLYLYWFRLSPLRSSPHLLIGIAILMTICIAYLTYRLIEKPSIEFGRKHFPGKVSIDSLPLESSIAARAK